MARARWRPEVGDDPDRWTPPVSGWERGRERGRLGPTWAERGREREKRRWAENGPRTKKGEILNFFE